jgi:hypothetical protein
MKRDEFRRYFAGLKRQRFRRCGSNNAILELEGTNRSWP